MKNLNKTKFSTLYDATRYFEKTLSAPESTSENHIRMICKIGSQEITLEASKYNSLDGFYWDVGETPMSDKRCYEIWLEHFPEVSIKW